jgi:hypothetical protein
VAKENNSLSSGKTPPAAHLLLLIVVFTCIFQAHPSKIQAQTFDFSLDTFSELYQEATWDTMHVGDIHYLQIGQYYRMPNFLPYDFRRIHVIEEYAGGGAYKYTFEVPRTHSFAHEEEKQGVFWYIKPRNLDIPDLKIEIESIDAIAERRRMSSLHDVWRSTLIESYTSKKVEQTGRKGLIHVDIPLPLGPLEKVLGKGDQTNIDISGRESITFAGESRRVDPFIGVEGQKKQPLFPSLEMKQELDIRLKGQVGEKVNVQVDHTSQEFSENANKIRLNYVGFDDDIVQLIELGNTSLTLPGGQAGGVSAASKGLFGIKMLAQMGPVDITAIASKQEGEVSSASFTPTGGAIGQTEERIIPDINYVDNTYFYLDSPRGPFIRPNVGEIEVYVSVNEIERQNTELITRFGLAFVDTTARGTPIRAAKAAFEAGQETPQREEGYFKELLFGTDYRYVLNAEDESVEGIELFQRVEDSRILAVRYVNVEGDTVGDYLTFPVIPVQKEGEPEPNPEDYPIFLEVIKPRNPRPTNQFGYTWDFMMRFIYNLGLTDIDAATLVIEIEDRSNNLINTSPQGETVPYIRIFGLDRYDQSGIEGPDNLIDLQAGLIDFNRGLLTFPSLRPFDPDLANVARWVTEEDSFVVPDEYVDLNLANPTIYDDYLSSTDLQEARRYNIVVRAASTTRSFKIDAFNITEGSEAITLDGRRLTRGTDYTIDYLTGEVELTGDVVNELTPSSQIRIDYEFKPFAGGASSSLVGFNALWNISSQSRFGTTWLYESKSTGSLKPRLGEEPTRAVVGDLYGNFQFELNQLTTLVNLLPLVDTDAPSTVKFGGGIAASFPDPNTKGEVYIDDMEGVEDSDLISLSRRNWWWASPPIEPTDSLGLTALEADQREKFYWYNIEPNFGVHRRDLNPELNERESNLVTTLDLEFDTTSVDPDRWGGLMTGFAGSGLDISKGQFIEIWINDFTPEAADRGGVVYLELGAIDEDFFEPDLNKENNEDKNKDGFTALTEDTGLDGLSNEEGDQSDDDYNVERDSNKRFTSINGTEGNFLLDSEDLDRSGVMDQKNFYFRYKLHLDSIAEVDIRRDYPNYEGFRTSGHEKDSWRLYRINLDEAEQVTKHGTPSLDQITHMRIWLRDVANTLDPTLPRLQIAELKIVGNRWEEDGFRDLAGEEIPESQILSSDFTMGIINTKTEPGKYKPPIVPAEQNEIFEKEQSLLIDYVDLEPERAFRIKKQFAGTGQDYTKYRDLNFWVYTDTYDESLEYYFQIAFNDTNYYEIAVPLTAAYFDAGGWMLVQIGLNDLSALKFLTPDFIVSGNAPDLTVPGRSYTIRMRGNPDLFRVRYLYAGLRNLNSRPDTLTGPFPNSASGELWLNDVYLGSVKRDIDFTSSVNGGINFGNVIRLNASWRRTGPDYRGLQQRRGSGSLNQGYSISGKTNVEHFIPLFGFRIPISGNYSSNASYPKFPPNSDTEIDDKVKQDSLRTETTTRGFSTTLTRKGSKNPLMKYTFDKLNANFSMSQSRMRSPTRTDTTTRMSGTFDYQMNWSQGRDIRLFKNTKFRYWLNSLSYRMSATRTTGESYKLFNNTFVRERQTWSANLQQAGSATYVPFQSLTTSFKMNVARDLRLPHKFVGIDIGRETKRNHSVQMSYKPPKVWILKALSPDLNFASGYNEDSSPNVRRSGDPFGVRNVGTNRTINAKAGFGLGNVFKKLFRTLHLEEKPKKAQTKQPEQPPLPPTGARVDSTFAADSTAVAADTSRATVETASKRDPLLPLRKLGGILGRIRKIDASIQQRMRSTYSRIPGRPKLEYQLGLTKRSGVIHNGITYNQPQDYNRSIGFNLNSGVQITDNIDMAARYSRNFATRDFRNSEHQTRSGNWPDINVSWKGLEKFGLISSFVNSATANFSLRKNWTETGKKGTVDSHNENVTITPSLSASWKNGVNSTASVLITKQSTDSHGSKNENSQFSVTLDIKKSFTGGERGFRVPLPFISKRIKFKSRLDSSLGITYSRRGGKRFLPGSDRFDELPKTTLLKVSPRLTYNFSSSLNGSFFADYSRGYSDASNQTTTTVRIGITTILTF